MSLTLWQPKCTDGAPLGEETAKAILGKLHARYGARFADMWRGVPEGKLLREWARELAGFSRDEIVRGLDACRAREWPPTLPEFMALCRPPIEAEAAFHEAQEGIRAREDHKPFTWTHPAIYWAAVDFGGFNLRSQDWRTARVRWTRLLEIRMAMGSWAEIPPPPAALLPDAKGTPMPPFVRQQLAALLRQKTNAEPLDE